MRRKGLSVDSHPEKLKNHELTMTTGAEQERRKHQLPETASNGHVRLNPPLGQMKKTTGEQSDRPHGALRTSRKRLLVVSDKLAMRKSEKLLARPSQRRLCRRKKSGHLMKKRSRKLLFRKPSPTGRK
jgi:hypothetical protein